MKTGLVLGGLAVCEGDFGLKSNFSFLASCGLFALKGDSLGAPSVQGECGGGLLCVALKTQYHPELAHLEFIGADGAQHIRRKLVHARRPRGVDNREHSDSAISHAQAVNDAEFLAPIVAGIISQLVRVQCDFALFLILALLRFVFLGLHQTAEVDVGNLVRAPGGAGASDVAKTSDRKMLLRKAQQLRAIAAPRAAVAHGVQAAVILKTEALGVVKNLAIVQLAALLDFAEEFLAADARAIEVFVPLEQVFDGGMHGAVAGLLEIRDIERVAVLVLLFTISQRAIGDERGVVIAILRVRHFQRGKNILAGEFAQGLAADALDNHGEQEKSGVAVEPVAAGSEIEGLLAGNQRQRVGVSGHAVGINSGKLHQAQVVAQAAGVIQQMQNGNFLAVGRQLGNVLPDVIVDGKFALFLEQENAGGGELLGRGTNIEDELRGAGDILFDVRQAVALGVDDFAVAIH